MHAVTRVGLSALGAAILAFGWQAWAWVERNGWQTARECVNHFGERYACLWTEWVARGVLSPFAWPGLLLLFGICWVLLGWARRRVERLPR
jgi:hypothetical protein